MIVECSGCGKRYWIDPSKIKERAFNYKCKVCDKLNHVESQNISENQQSVGNGDAFSPPAIQTSPVSVDTTEMALTRKKKDNLIRIPSSRSKESVRFLGITGKVTAIMLMISIIPLIVLWTSSYQRLNTQLHQDTETLMLETASGLSKQINEWVDKNVRIVYMLSSMPDIISMDPARQTPLLRLTQAAYPWMYLVFTMGPDGMNIARNDNDPLKDYKDRIYVQGALSGKQLTWETIVSRTNKKPAIVFSTPIRSGDRILGVMAAGVNLFEISSQISAWRKGQSGYAFLIDDTYKVVAHQVDDFVQKQEIFENHPLIQKHKKGARGLIRFNNAAGIPSVGVVTQTEQGWLLAIQQEEREAFAILTKEKLFAFILLTITIFLVGTISWFSGRAITIPIKKVTLAADRISVGEFDVALDTNKRDEIGDLARSVIRMKECIRISLDRLQKRRSSRPK
jgi:methyl-accepting chemotaxis protein